MDVLESPRCQGRLRVLAVITEREPVRRILAHLGVPIDVVVTGKGGRRISREDVVDEDSRHATESA